MLSVHLKGVCRYKLTRLQECVGSRQRPITHVCRYAWQDCPELAGKSVHTITAPNSQVIGTHRYSLPAPIMCSACNRDRRSRRHFLECDLIPAFLWSDLPRAPPDVYPIDFALNSLPRARSAACPPWWSSLLLMLWHIQRLCAPTRDFPIDSSPGSSWSSRSSTSG